MQYLLLRELYINYTDASNADANLMISARDIKTPTAGARIYYLLLILKEFVNPKRSCMHKTVGKLLDAT